MRLKRALEEQKMKVFESESFLKQVVAKKDEDSAWFTGEMHIRSSPLVQSNFSDSLKFSRIRRRGNLHNPGSALVRL